MKRTRKYIAALAVLAAGSVFYGSEPANAGGIELDGITIVFGREHDAPPPPPPPPHMHHHGPHMPPPPHHRGFAPGPHTPPPPHHHHGPRGHMPPPHHRW